MVSFLFFFFIDWVIFWSLSSCFDSFVIFLDSFLFFFLIWEFSFFNFLFFLLIGLILEFVRLIDFFVIDKFFCILSRFCFRLLFFIFSIFKVCEDCFSKSTRFWLSFLVIWFCICVVRKVRLSLLIRFCIFWRIFMFFFLSLFFFCLVSCREFIFFLYLFFRCFKSFTSSEFFRVECFILYSLLFCKFNVFWVFLSLYFKI